MLSPTEIFDRIYSGFLGKAIGVRLGAPVEPTIWSYERIRHTYGEVTQYLRDFKNFAADDDTNGPVYFIRALRDYGLQATAADVGRTWLNYAAEEHGMYWWGGFGNSTEHTAYKNLKAGMEAPESGSIATNGSTVAEQIGGQIFIDSWGWVNPGNPKRAADMSAMAASVAHDGDGLNGARFCAAAIAQAFVAKSIDEIVETGLSTIDANSTYARVARAVIDFHKANPTDWRACRDMLGALWGYDRYPGVCHIIPNAGVTVMAILYGEGDLPRTAEIATMAGWDTDCNAGNACAIVATFQQVQPGWDKYRKPINDFVVASGVIGTLNVVDAPSFARELTVLALRLNGSDVPALWAEDFERRGVRFDFDAPGSTHGFRTEPFNQIEVKAAKAKPGPNSRGSLEVLLDRLERGQGGRVFWKPFYRRADFDDERYRPMFTPLADAGQTVKFKLQLDPWNGDGNLRVAPYVRRAISQEIVETGAWHVPSSDGWQDYAFVIPEGDEAIDEIGVLVEYFGRLKFLGRLFLSEFSVGGKGHLAIDPKVEKQEWGGITRFTWNRGHWSLQNGVIHAHTAEDADAWTGNGYLRDATVTADLTPLAGKSHLVAARVQGTSRFYAAGIENGEAVIVRQDHGATVLARVPYEATPGQPQVVSLTVQGESLSLAINGQALLSASDGAYRYGQAGLRMGSAGRMTVQRLEVVELLISFDATATGPLDGIRVIDLSRLVAGNMLSLQLADFGADIIKIEPPQGDPLREWRDDGHSLYWKTYGRNKRSVKLNLREATHMAALKGLLKTADVFIENFRPGTLEEMGLAPETLLEANPNLIIVRISGFGQTGPYAQFPGFGTIVEGMSGFAYRTGFPDREPILPPLALADMIAGVYGANATVTALFARFRGKVKGQVIDLSLLEPMYSVLGPEAAIYRVTGKVKERSGSASNTASPRNVYACADGQYVALSGSTPQVARRIFEVIGKPEINDDPRFKTNSDRVKHRDLVDAAIGEWFARHTHDEALGIMREAGATVGPIYSIADIARDQHFVDRGIIVDVEDKQFGSLPMHNILPRLSDTPGTFRRPAPELGEHTAEVMTEAGIDPATVLG